MTNEPPQSKHKQVYQTIQDASGFLREWLIIKQKKRLFFSWVPQSRSSHFFTAVATLAIVFATWYQIGKLESTARTFVRALVEPGVRVVPSPGERVGSTCQWTFKLKIESESPFGFKTQSTFRFKIVTTRAVLTAFWENGPINQIVGLVNDKDLRSFTFTEAERQIKLDLDAQDWFKPGEELQGKGKRIGDFIDCTKIDRVLLERIESELQ